MTFQCPACQRSFPEPGFCPYDGTQLGEVGVAQKPTVLSEIMAAQHRPDTDPPHDTLTERASTQSGVGDPSTKLRAMSAQRSHTSVVETLRREPASSEYDRLIGETLDGRYFVERKIGEGGMGVVFAARHAVIERPLAIKVLKREVMRDTATIKRFVQEAKAASRIGHPNIVDVTDFGTTPDGMTYSVMEYIDGVTLSRAIKDRAPMPPEQAIAIAQQIARALGAAHDKGIVHRDLKPDNVFLIDRDERIDFVKIVDFGIAKVQPIEGSVEGPRLTRVGSVFGTPEYMAPEQAAGRSDTDRRVDIYALGTILYEMIVGRTPHKSDSTVHTIAMQMIDPIIPPSQLRPELAVPKPLELAIMKALAKPRDERYQTMAELIAALDAVAQHLKREGLLPKLPPGADLAELVAPATIGTRPIKQTRKLHEPAFAQGPLTLSPPVLYEAGPAEPDEPARRWPYVILGLVVLLGAGGGALFYAMRGRARVAAREDAGAVSPHDAMRVITEVEDAAITADAEEVPAPPSADAGVRVPRDAGLVLLRPPHAKVITVEVLTRPAEANVFEDHTFRGPSGARLTEPYGTKLELECRAPHYKGHVTVIFDGSRDSVMCTAKRLPFCVKGLKNVFDDCEQVAPETPQEP